MRYTKSQAAKLGNTEEMTTTATDFDGSGQQYQPEMPQSKFDQIKDQPITTGLSLIGAIGGGIGGHKLAKKHKVWGAIGGVIVGGWTGRIVGTMVEG